MRHGLAPFRRLLNHQTLKLLIHLDAHYWRPNWIKPDRQTWRLQQRKLVKGERWILDRFYPSTLDERLPHADTVIVLDLPRWLCFGRTIKRQWQDRGKHRIDINAGCVEQLNWESMRSAWQAIMREYPAQRDRMLQQMSQMPVQLVRLRSPYAVKAFLVNSRQETGSAMDW